MTTKKRSKAYWERRSEQQLLDLLDQADEVKDKLERYYSKAIRYINRDIKTLFGRYMTDNGIDIDKAMGLLSGNDYKEWRFAMEEYLQQIEATGNKALLLELNTLTMRKRITRLLALRAGILAISAILAQIEDEQVGDFLEKGLTDTYYRTMYDEYRDENPEAILLTEEHKVKPSKDNIKAILTNPWSGSNYSENIWTNSYLIAKRAEQAITKNIIAGKSINNLTNELERVYGNKYRANIKRLLRTETAYIKGQGDILAYKKLKVEEYEILATLDNRTSSICRSKDGKHYPIDEATVGENYPPFHPNCRTTTIKYIANQEKRAKRTRLARDKNGKNVKVPLGMKYEDWKKWVKNQELGYIKNKENLLKISPNSSLEIINRVKNGEIKLNSNRGHYEKHVAGTKQYEKYLNNRKNRGWGPQNRLTISEDEVQEIINNFHGKGIVYHGKNNNKKWFEEVNVGKTIGYYYLDGKERPTSKIRIYYGNKGTHIVPIRGDDFD